MEAKRRPGFWKPYISGALGGLAGGATSLLSGLNPITGAVSGAKQGYDTHEGIRKKYNISWLGKKKKKGKKAKKTTKKRKTTKKKKSKK